MYGHLSTVHREYGRGMTVQFDKERQHHNSEHVELRRGVSGESEEGHKPFNLGLIGTISQCHRMKGISISVPSALDLG